MKLSHLLPFNICHLLCNYLSSRSFFVIYGAYSASPGPVTAEVPQGSVLEPLLSTLYTVEFPTPPDITAVTFTDDIAILACQQITHKPLQPSKKF